MTQKQEMKMSTGLASLKAQMDQRMKVFHSQDKNKKKKGSDDDSEDDDSDDDSDDESD